MNSPINQIKAHQSKSWHVWGDKDCDWQGLDNALAFIEKWCNRFRIRTNGKEKYGVLRYDFDYLDFNAVQKMALRAIFWTAFARWPRLWLEIGTYAPHEVLGLKARDFGWKKLTDV